MILHVLPGDAILEEFKKTGIEGDVAVCREAFVEGDVSGDTLPEFWERRAQGHGDADTYHEKIVREFAKLTALQSDSEIALWFEYELFCNVNMWFCLSLLTESSANISRIVPSTLQPDEIWNGFGMMGPEDLRQCFAQRVEFSPADVQLGAALWEAFRRRDHARLAEISRTDSPCFPFLKEVCEAELEKDTRPREIVRALVHSGKSDFNELFVAFRERAGVYGFGDSQVKRLFDEV